LNKYETGSYLVTLFDKHGSKISGTKFPNLHESEKFAKEMITTPPEASYVIQRTVQNSQDQANPWNTRPKIRE